MCTVLLDSGADTSVVAGDLVPEAALTGESMVIDGIHSINKVVPLARLMLEIGERRIWLTAVIVEKPPQDILLGRNCSELKELLKQALTSKQQVTAVTRHQPKLENEEKLLDQVADSNWEEGNFPFPTEFEPLEKFQTKKIILQSRNCKRVDNLLAFSESCQEIESEEKRQGSPSR